MCHLYYWRKKVDEWENQRAHWLLDRDLPLEDWRETPAYPMNPGMIVKLHEGDLIAAKAHFGLVPHWAEMKSGRNCYNARSETVRTKPTFRQAFKERRCLIPAVSYVDYADLIKEREGRNQLVKFRIDGGEQFMCAGIWERKWIEPKGKALFDSEEKEVYDSFSIITAEANEFCGLVHSRMPVILHPPDYMRWLEEGDQSLLVPFKDCDRMSIEYIDHPPRKKKELERAA